jgi:quinol monooxygenase YgiN
MWLDRENDMIKNQPGVVLRFQAKRGKGDELFQLVTDLHYSDDPDGPLDWVLSRDAGNADVMWAFEFYRDQASFDRHYSNPALDEPHQRVFDLLADDEGLDSSMRVDVHIVAAA